MILHPFKKGIPSLKNGSERFYSFSIKTIKLTVLILTLGCLQVNAADFSQGVTLSYRNGKSEMKATALADGTIKGKVVDNTGVTLPGVTIKLEGAAVQTKATDPNGNYSFTNLPSGTYTLSFTYLGFARAIKQLTLTDGQETVIDIVLVEDASSLDEVVVIGYGTQKKSDVTGSAVRVSMEDKELQSNTNLLQALSGASAGINVQGAGLAGGEPSISIRGQTSLSASGNPLVVLDGII